MKKIVYLKVEELHPHPDNPRKALGDLTELADSIKSKGVLQNLTVVRKDEGYTVIIGHRRLSAAKLAGLEELPCVIADMTPQEQFDTMMVENMQRSDLTVYEQAQGFQMMLDMGGTVDSISQKTGFSASTIRNRVKLLELDKKKFEKAESRGGSLQDYIKLNEISDPELRNKVLDTIGTPNFVNQLKNALEKEKYKAFFEKARADIEAADWCQEMTDKTEIWNKYDFVRSVNRWSQAEITRPDDSDTVKYFYIFDHSGDGFSIYKKKNGKKADPKEAKRKKVAAKITKIKDELDGISKTHGAMRKEFVRNFTAIKSHAGAIQAFAAKTLIMFERNRYQSGLDEKRLSELLDIPLKGGHLDASVMEKVVSDRPLYALLHTSLSMMDGDWKYVNTNWDNKALCCVPIPMASRMLDTIYAFLCELGYEMSDEELAMQKGEHHLFRDAKELLKQFQDEEEAKSGDNT